MFLLLLLYASTSLQIAYVSAPHPVLEAGTTLLQALLPWQHHERPFGAKENGTVAFKEFCNERLDVSATKDFFDPLKKQRL